MQFSHDSIFDASVLRELIERDRASARVVQQAGCRFCGSALDRASYVRKGRGLPPEMADIELVRESFCCRQEGCRRRTTPPSSLFLGRRVYLAPVVVLVSARSVGKTHREARSAGALFGVSPRTIGRWRRFWSREFSESAFFQVARGAFARAIDVARLPASLLEAFGGDLTRGTLVGALAWLATPVVPVTGVFIK